MSRDAGAAGRRTQQERSRDMKALLVEATLDCLQSAGYHGASIGMILDRAKVSRGAWAHHFATKQDLIAAAAETMMAEADSAARAVTAAVEGQENRVGALIEQVWDRFYRGRHRDVLFELVVACRTDRDLAQRLAPLFSRFVENLLGAWGSAAADATHGGDFFVLTLFMLRGMAMQDMLAERADRNAALRHLWSDITRGVLEARQDRPPSRPS